MRADRLVAILLMLQQRGQVTAAQVADELEVSERTARRDLDALAMAGVPVYSQPGRGGGWRLAGGGRIDLSGLSAPEARALFLVAGPNAATPEVRAALRKLVRALPEPLRHGAEAAAAAVAVDPTGWDRSQRSVPPLLDELQSAVVDGEVVQLTYEGRDGRRSEREVEPLGVASKGHTWYLVAGTDAGRRTFRVDRVLALRRVGRSVVRPEGFDLQREWGEIVSRIDQMRTPVQVSASATPEAVGYLRAMFGTRLRSVGTVGAAIEGAVEAAVEGGRTVAVELRGHSVVSLAAELAGFAAMVEVHEPVELRLQLAELGRHLCDTYADQVPQ